MKEMNLLGLGLILILVGFLIVIISLVSSGKSEIKYSFFGLIGPLPFGFGNDKKLFVFTMIIALVFFILFFIFRKYFFA